MTTLADMTHLFTDVDGVLTDNRIGFNNEGQRLRFFNAADVIGLNKLIHYGLKVYIISGSEDNARYAKHYGFQFIHTPNNKLATIEPIFKDVLKQSIFIGNDLEDIDLLESCGMPMCPYDASRQVIKCVALRWGHIFNLRGGEGVLRRVSDVLFGLAP